MSTKKVPDEALAQRLILKNVVNAYRYPCGRMDLEEDHIAHIIKHGVMVSLVFIKILFEKTEREEEIERMRETK